jgi:hypothetical protein
MSVMRTASLNQLLNAIEWVSTDFLDNEAYICRQTGQVYLIAGDPGMLDEEDEIPEDIHDSDKYQPIPDKRDLDLGNRVAFDFASQHLPQRYDDVRDMFRSPGAYGRFKGLLQQKELLQEWYRYSDEQVSKAVAEWCQSEGFALRP